MEQKLTRAYHSWNIFFWKTARVFIHVCRRFHIRKEHNHGQDLKLHMENTPRIFFQGQRDLADFSKIKMWAKYLYNVGRPKDCTFNPPLAHLNKCRKSLTSSMSHSMERKILNHWRKSLNPTQRLGFLGFDRTGGGPKCPHPLIFLRIIVWPPNLARVLTMWYLIDQYDFYLMTTSWLQIMTSLRIVTSYDVIY